MAVCILFLKAFLSTWAFMRACNLHSMHILGPVLMLFIGMFYTQVKQRVRLCKRDKVIAAMTAIVFTFIFLSCQYQVLLQGLDNKLFQILILCVCACGFFSLFYNILCYLFSFYLDWKNKSITSPNATAQDILDKWPSLKKHLPLVAFLLCFISWIPWFLYSYPAIMTPDSINQLEQILHMIPYCNHHPVAHTLTIQLFYQIGFMITKTVNGGIACYTLFQMAFMACCVAFLIKTMQLIAHQSLPCILSMLYFAFMPYHCVMAVTMWKDVMFAGFSLLLTCCLIQLLFLNVSWHTYAIYVFSLLGFGLFRSNGFYASILLFPFFLIVFRKKWKLYYPLHFAVLIALLLIRGPIMEKYEINQPDTVMSLSIPIQQIARVIVDDRELSKNEWEQIDHIIDHSYVKELYTSYLADNMNELVRAGNPDYLTAHRADYLFLWFKLGMRYPDEFFNAFVDQTYGYYDAAAYYTVADTEGIVPSDTGAFAEPILYGKIPLKIREILIKLHTIIPIYGALWSMGVMLWIVIIFMDLTLIGTKKISLTSLLPYVPTLALVFTLLLATPVATEFRYAYSIFYTTPVLATMALFLTKDDEKNIS